MKPEEFGAFVQARRKMLGMSQAALAEKLYVTAKAVSRWERGVGFPDIKLLEPLADALEVTLIELMQSRLIEQPIPENHAAVVVADTVDSIRSRAEMTRKRNLNYMLGLLIIGGSASFLYCLGRFYAFEVRWVGGLLRFIALVGGIWGWQAYRSILTEDYLKEQKEGVWFTWKPWAASIISAAGLALVTFLKDLVPRDSRWYGLMVMAGFVLLFTGGYYLRRYLFPGEEDI